VSQGNVRPEKFDVDFFDRQHALIEQGPMNFGVTLLELFQTFFPVARPYDSYIIHVFRHQRG